MSELKLPLYELSYGVVDLSKIYSIAKPVRDGHGNLAILVNGGPIRIDSFTCTQEYNNLIEAWTTFISKETRTESTERRIDPTL